MKWPHTISSVLELALLSGGVGRFLAIVFHQRIVFLARDRQHGSVANFRRKIIFVPRRLLVPRNLKPRPLKARRDRKPIRHAGILLIVKIPSLPVRRRNQCRRLAKIWTDRNSRLGIG